MRQIFVSFSSSDQHDATTFAQSLKTERPRDRVLFSAELDSGPAGGTRWRSWIKSSLENSDLVIYLASSNSTSPWCNAELGMALLLNKPILPLSTGSAGPINPLIEHIQAIPLSTPIEEIVRRIDQLAPEGDLLATPPTDFTPYPGLLPLTEQQAVLLCGRQTEIGRVLGDLGDGLNNPVLLLSGPSGSGKSSLIRAGLLPRLRSRGWSVIGPLQPHQLSQTELPSTVVSRSTVIVIDQLEELVRLGHDFQTRFSQFIRRSTESGASAILSVRSEFRDQIGELIPRPIDHYIPFLTRMDLFDVIKGPARIANASVQQSVVDRLVLDAESGQALPLLALTLKALWEARDPGTNEISDETLAKVGGVQTILRNSAQAALRASTQGSPELVDPVLATLSRLADPDQIPATRLPMRVAALDEEQRRWLDAFVVAGLLVYRTSFAMDDRLEVGLRPTGDEIVDVSHEALLRWEPLADQIENRRARNLLRRSIDHAARQWIDGGKRDKSLLLSGDRLRFAHDEGIAATDELARAFVEASDLNDRDRRRQRLLFRALAVLTAVAVAAAGWATVSTIRVASQRNRAQEAEIATRGLRMVAQSNEAIAKRRDFSLLAAVAAYRLHPSIESEMALSRSLTAPNGPLKYFRSAGARWETLRIASENQGIVANSGGGASIVDLDTGAMTPIGVGSILDQISIDDLSRVAGSALVLFRGSTAGGIWKVGAIDTTTGDVMELSHSEAISAMAATNTMLAYGDLSGQVFVTRISGGEIQRTVLVSSQAGEITDIALDPIGSLLASVAADGVVLSRYVGGTWTEAENVHETEVGAAGVKVVEFAATTQRPGTDDNVANTQVAKLYGSGSDPRLLEWTITESEIAESELGRHVGYVETLAVDPGGRSMLIGGMGGTIQEWDLEARVPLALPMEAHTRDVLNISWLGGIRFLSTDETGTTILWDRSPARTIERSSFLPQAWRGMAVQAVVQGEGALAILDTSGRVLLDDGREWSGPSDAQRSWWVGDSIVFERRSPLQGMRLDASKDGKIETVIDGADSVDVAGCQAAGSFGATLRFVDVGDCASSMPSIRWTTNNTSAAALAFSSDGSHIVVAGTGALAEVSVIDLEKNSSVVSFHSNQAEEITGVAWTAPGIVVIGHDRGGSTEVVHLDDIESRIELSNHTDAVRWIVGAVDGSRVFLGSEDGSISVVALDEPIREVASFSSTRARYENDLDAAVRGLQVAMDGKVLLSLQGTKLTAWELEPGALADAACAAAGRQLEPEERRSLGVPESISIC